MLANYDAFENHFKNCNPVNLQRALRLLGESLFKLVKSGNNFLRAKNIYAEFTSSHLNELMYFVGFINFPSDIVFNSETLIAGAELCNSKLNFSTTREGL